MQVIWTKTKTFVALGLLLALGAGYVVKAAYFPDVDDRLFQLDYNRLQKAPRNIFVVRPTQHGESKRTGFMTGSVHSDEGKYKPRYVGRNVTVRQMLAAAYLCQESRMVFPDSMPTNRYDVLNTLETEPAEHFQKKIKSKFGYTASWQNRDTDILLLKVAVPDSPGLRASTNDQSNSKLVSGRLCFTHMPVGQISWMVERALNKPVLDRTGLTGFYDYSLPWGWPRLNGLDPDKVHDALTSLGLKLEDDNESMQMMVVEKAR